MFAASKTASASGDYQISRSLRFNSADSAYLNRTPASTSSQTTATFSAWVKRSRLGSAAENRMFAESTGSGAGLFWVLFTTSDQLQVLVNGTGTNITSTQVFRDPSAWYHIVAAVDTNQATSSDRIKIYVNGTQITDFTGTQTYYTLGQLVKFNVTTTTNYIGYNNSQAFDGYMTEVNWIDGQQLTPSSFGETNAQTGVWQPKAYSGSYGTNGFYLNFSDNSNTTAATLGKDYSGNGNNWTPNNFSVSAGAGNDSLVDVPTSYGLVDTGVGGEVRGNYCTANPLDMNSSLVIRNGNLDVTESGSTWINGRCTIGVSSGKWYFESTLTTGSFQVVGIANSLAKNTGYESGSGLVGNWAYSNDGAKIINGVYTTPYGASFSTNNVIGVAFDADAGTLTMYKNGTSQGTLVSGLAANTYFPWVAVNGSTVSMNFGQRPFAYTAPSGYKALCTQNLPTPTIGATTATQAGKYFNTVIYNGANLTPQNITTVGFQPDFVWIKWRANSSYYHNLFDVIRGVNNVLSTNVTSAEGTRAGTLTAFNSDGFSLGNDSTYSGVNIDATSYVAWNWKANGSGSSNTSGSITSTVSASTTSGFSVVTYTGNGTAGATVGHGLGVAPSIMFIKGRTNVDNWHVYSSALGNTGGLFLNLTNAFTVSTYFWNNTSPSSTVFTLSSGSSNNSSGVNYVAYCFSEVAGYSKFGSYTGNGSTDGPFVFTGFRPAYVLIKQSSDINSWFIWDSSRSSNNVASATLKPNSSDAEETSYSIDILSNGFKIRTSDSRQNTNAGTYIYACFASAPQKFSLAR